MKQFLSFVQKEFHHIFRDVRTLIIIFGIPIAEILIFGYAINTEVKNAHIAIFDQSKDASTQKIINKLLAGDYFKLEREIKNEKEIEDAFAAGNIKEVIVFEPNFEQKLQQEGRAEVQLLLDASEPNTANIIENYTRSILQAYSREQNVTQTQNLQITPLVRMHYNPDLKSVFMFVPGTMAIILILISALMTSVAITREKELGTLEILLSSPLKPVQIILGKVTPYFILSFINVLSILLLAVFVFHIPIKGSLILLIAECLLFILLALSIGIMISTVVKTMQQAMLISMVGLMMPSMLLSGFIFPVQNMPLPLYYLSFIMPPRWFIVVVKDIMIKGGGLNVVWQETLILIGMTLFFIGMSIKKFKVRLE